VDVTHKYLAIGEVAAAFGVTVATVRNWERAGKIRAFRTLGNQRRFAASDVDELLEQPRPSRVRNAS
jgi:excisionase family DNA binding protein